MSKAPKTGLTKKHWFGYMFGDWAVVPFMCKKLGLEKLIATMLTNKAVGE